MRSVVDYDPYLSDTAVSVEKPRLAVAIELEHVSQDTTV